jgi:hypothetical protein
MLTLSEFLQLASLHQLQLNRAPCNDCEDDSEDNASASEANAILL